jgi:hypothetical protein
MSKRKTISKKLRFEVFKRDSFACQYCGATPPKVVLELDHVTPIASGGTDEETNLITSCFDCNRGKSDRDIANTAQPILKQLENQVEKIEQLKQYNEYLIAERTREDGSIYLIGRDWCNRFALPHELDAWHFGPSREVSLRRFLRMLPIVEIYAAMEIAFSRLPVIDRNDDRTWQYFCGICWKTIKRGNDGTR